MKLLWHYTVNRHIVDILKSGYVDVARTNVYEPEKPVAWFSSAQFWDLTVRRSVMVRDDDGPSPPWTLLEMYAYGIHACRIGVLPESAPLNWTALRIQANIQPKTVRHLLKVANEWGANPWE